MRNKIVKGFPSTSQNSYQLNITNILRHAARTYRDQEVVCETGVGTFRYTYGKAYKRARKMADALTRLGILPGDRVGVLDWNTYRHFELYYAIPGTGAVLLLINLRLAPHDQSYVVNHSGAQWLCVDESLLPLAEAFAPLCSGIKGFIVMTDKGLDRIETSLKPVWSYEALLEEGDDGFEWPVMDENSAYGACYTTGTTGKPKGIFYSHRAVYLHAMAVATNTGLSCSNCLYQLVPMFHALGWGTPHSAPLVGAKYVLPGMYNLENLGSLTEPMIREKVDCGAGAPALFMPMVEYIKNLKNKPDFSGARFVCGASEPALSMMKEFNEMTGGEIIHVYGASETNPLVTINMPQPRIEETLDDVEKWNLMKKQGFPVVGVDLKVVDLFGKELPHDGVSIGEILIRGPWITGGYHGVPHSPDQFTPDGYWRSGDMGSIDENGYLKLTDRIKDVIKSGGEWISSIDMENEIMDLDAVQEACVVGVAHPKWEERPLALVVLSPAHNTDDIDTVEEAIRVHLEKKYARWQLPDKLLFVDVLPKTSVGKMDKKTLRSEYNAIYTS